MTLLLDGLQRNKFDVYGENHPTLREFYKDEGCTVATKEKIRVIRYQIYKKKKEEFLKIKEIENEA